MAVRAQAKYIRVAPRKAREVVDLIRGKSVAEARSTLFFANRNAARVVARVLNSAVANAENNKALSADDLYVKEARVDEGPTLKRWQFRACLLYTSDAADDLLCVDLGGRRIIKKKKKKT